MQAVAADSALREGIEAMGVTDSEKPAAGQEEESTAEHKDTEMTAATEEEDSAAKDEAGAERHLKHEGQNMKDRGPCGLRTCTHCRGFCSLLPTNLDQCP
ncbi:hypothetical protein ILYODFUR_018462 [Ilyodon furcidens]|uniref:Uncharacterized protein n=1 Tax=Ilyodon furcidens TaxID=33524 RepID=A0ABV0U7R4_9TELE